MAEDFLSALEARVKDAAERIHTLKQENAELAARVAELEERASAEGAEAAWVEEREELRRRVEALVATLEGLLDG